jgi:hypothetical protein
MRNLNDSLALLSREDPERWDDYLQGVQFGYNITEHAATGETPFALNYDRLPALVEGEGREAAEPEGTAAAYVRRLRRALRQAQDRARRCLEGYYGQMKARFDRGRRERTWAASRSARGRASRAPSLRRDGQTRGRSWKGARGQP